MATPLPVANRPHAGGVPGHKSRAWAARGISPRAKRRGREAKQAEADYGRTRTQADKDYEQIAAAVADKKEITPGEDDGTLDVMVRVTGRSFIAGSSGFRWRAFHRFNQSDLLSVDDFESPLLIVKNHGLPIRTDHEVIGMRHDERLLVAEHNPNRSKGCGMHQLFDLIGDHGDKARRRSWRRQGGNRWKQVGFEGFAERSVQTARASL